MAARWAYWAKEVGGDAAVDAPRFARLRRAWPNLVDAPDERWQIQKHPDGGSLLVWPGTANGAGVALASFGEPRPTHDGLVYYPSSEAPTKEDLIRPEQHRLPGTWVNLTSGDALYVALATATPRELVLRATGGIARGKYQNEFGHLAHDLYDPFQSDDGIAFDDPRLARILQLMLQQSYFVTEEMAEDLPWLSTADVVPILHCILGVNPKASAAAPAGSASADPSMTTSP